MTPEFKARWEAYQREQSHGGYTFVPGDEHIFRDAWNLAIKAAAASMPDTWLDSLLTGPTKVMRSEGDFTCPDIEALCRGIKARIEAMTESPSERAEP